MIIYRWTGIECKALREAMRMSVGDFAKTLDVSKRSVEGWEKQGADARLRGSSERLFEKVLAQAPADVMARFTRALGAGDDIALEADPAARKTVTLANDTVSLVSPLALGAEEPDQVWVPARTAAGEVVIVSLPRRTIVTGIGVGALAAATHLKPAPSRVDEGLLASIEAILAGAKQQDDALGAAAVLGTVLAQVRLVESLRDDCPARLQPRLTRLYADLCRFAGWLYFDLGDFTAADRMYDKAWIAAHESENVDIGVFVLSHQCHLAHWQALTTTDQKRVAVHKRVAVDRAAAAMHWAGQSEDLLLRADTAEMAARAYAGVGDTRACLNALDINATMTDKGGHARASSLAYFYGPTLSAAARSHCFLQLGDPREAEQSARESLALTGSSFVRDRAFSLLDLGRAQIALGKVDEAVSNLGLAAAAVSATRSARLASSLRTVRSGLNRWADTTEVKTLDGVLAGHRLATYRLSAGVE